MSRNPGRVGSSAQQETQGQTQVPLILSFAALSVVVLTARSKLTLSMSITVPTRNAGYNSLAYLKGSEGTIYNSRAGWKEPKRSGETCKRRPRTASGILLDGLEERIYQHLQERAIWQDLCFSVEWSSNMQQFWNGQNQGNKYLILFSSHPEWHWETHSKHWSQGQVSPRDVIPNINLPKHRR